VCGCAFGRRVARFSFLVISHGYPVFENFQVKSFAFIITDADLEMTTAKIVLPETESLMKRYMDGSVDEQEFF
jgi:hypothetical protein